MRHVEERSGPWLTEDVTPPEHTWLIVYVQDLGMATAQWTGVHWLINGEDPFIEHDRGIVWMLAPDRPDQEWFDRRVAL